jgi:15-cis-phytoene synthase
MHLQLHDGKVSKMTSRSDLAACRALLRGGSRTFYSASHLLPRSVSRPATALYAFCRLADDAVDLRAGKLGALTHLRLRLDRAYEGRPFANPADRAFAEVVARFAVPRALPEALLEGLEWDARGRRYENFSALTDYAVRVAGSVGAMMSLLIGARAPHLVARACDLGVAMQLTNIARDVGEDARAGRLYLPLQWLSAAGIDPDAWLARPVFSVPLAAAVQHLLDQAEILYQRSGAGIACLPFSCRPGIRAARLLYAEIGREIERLGCDSISCRARVPWSRKLLLLVRSFAMLLPTEAGEAAPPLPQARYLIDAVAEAPMSFHGARREPKRSSVSGAIERRVVWLVELFERLERREQLERGRL